MGGTDIHVVGHEMKQGPSINHVTSHLRTIQLSHSGVIGLRPDLRAPARHRRANHKDFGVPNAGSETPEAPIGDG